MIAAAAAIGLAGAGAVRAQSASDPPREEVPRLVVILSRHGVRSPLPVSPPISAYAADPWPAWSVPPGDLTARGKDLARLLGQFYRALYSGRDGPLPTAGCPAPGSVFFWSDNVERDLRTSEGLLAGLAPGCGLTASFLEGKGHDPLFHPLEAGLCRMDLPTARAAVEGRYGGSLGALAAAYRAPLSRIQDVLRCCAPGACGAASRSPCTLSAIPSALEEDPKAGSLKLRGPISVGSTAVEDFLLEAAEGFPDSKVGWGRTTLDSLQEMFAVHTLQFDLMERTPYLAKHLASGLAARILATLEQGADGIPRRGARSGPDARFVAFVGHDTNVASLAGLLDLSWLSPGFAPNQTPPAGALVFELHDNVSAAPVVRVFYVTQTLDQMRRAAPLSLSAPPSRVPVFVPGCSGGGPAYDCPLPRLRELVRAAIEPACVAP